MHYILYECVARGLELEISDTEQIFILRLHICVILRPSRSAVEIYPAVPDEETKT
jgi:hypothetical protein